MALVSGLESHYVTRYHLHSLSPSLVRPVCRDPDRVDLRAGVVGTARLPLRFFLLSSRRAYLLPAFAPSDHIWWRPYLLAVVPSLLRPCFCACARMFARRREGACSAPSRGSCPCTSIRGGFPEHCPGPMA